MDTLRPNASPSGGSNIIPNVASSSGVTQYSTTQNFTVPSTATVGDNHCVTLRAWPSSSPSSTNSSSQECLNVEAAPDDWNVSAQDPDSNSVIFDDSYNKWVWEINTIEATNSGSGASKIGTDGQVDIKGTVTVKSAGGSVLDTFNDHYDPASNPQNISAGGTFSDTHTVELDTSSYSPGNVVCFYFEVFNPEGETDVAVTRAGPDNTTETCRQLPEAPYFEVNEASVIAGASFETNGSVATSLWCGSPSGTGEIKTLYSLDPNSHRGAYTDYAALATGPIDTGGFSAFATYHRNVASNYANQAALYDDINKLPFANTPNNGNYNSGGDGFCLPDYFNYIDKTAATSPTVASGNITLATGLGADSIYFYDNNATEDDSSADIDLSGLNLTNGDRITLVVDGDVTIEGNIDYNYSANSADDVPFFLLVTNGDINIEKSVTQLSGLYVAQNGTVDTCSNAGSNLLTIGSCSDLLTVTGAIAAQDIEFRRTGGGILSNTPAEIFTLNPEFYIAQPYIGDLLDLPQNQALDLPPAF